MISLGLFYEFFRNAILLNNVHCLMKGSSVS
jgi:hypothetical protein